MKTNTAFLFSLILLASACSETNTNTAPVVVYKGSIENTVDTKLNKELPKPEETRKEAIKTTERFDPEKSFVKAKVQPREPVERKLSLAEEKEAMLSNIDKYIQVESSKFKPRPNGGIWDFSLKISNKTSHKIDAVALNVEYLRANGDVFKTATIEVNNLDPKKPQVKKVPNNEVGSNVRYYITGVIASDIDFNYTLD